MDRDTIPGHDDRKAGYLSHAVNTANLQPARSARLQWGRIVVGALLLEIALIIVFVPLLMVSPTPLVLNLVVVGCVVFGFVVSWWAVRRVRSRPVFHATLIGVLATLIYLAL